MVAAAAAAIGISAELVLTVWIALGVGVVGDFLLDN